MFPTPGSVLHKLSASAVSMSSISSCDFSTLKTEEQDTACWELTICPFTQVFEFLITMLGKAPPW